MKVFYHHNIGHRPLQEDAILVDKKNKVFAVLDGVGGNNHGAYASNLIKEYIEKQLSEKSFKQSINSMSKLIINSEEVLVSEAKKNETYLNMATTLALLHLDDNKSATSYHIGDSRVYYFEMRPKNWSVTKDHSVSQESLDGGYFQFEQTIITKQITAALSTNQRKKPMNLSETKIEGIDSNDIFLLVTDGALENHNDEELTKHFMDETKPIEERWEQFSNACISNSKDNNSAILIQL